MTRLFSPRTLFENAMEDLMEESSKSYIVKTMLIIPFFLAIILFFISDLDVEILSYLGTILSILVGFSISSLILLISIKPEKTSEENEEDTDQEKFVSNLRHYVSYSMLIGLAIISLSTAMRISCVLNNFVTEILLFFLLVHYLMLILLILRRIETAAKINSIS